MIINLILVHTLTSLVYYKSTILNPQVSRRIMSCHPGQRPGQRMSVYFATIVQLIWRAVSWAIFIMCGLYQQSCVDRLTNKIIRLFHSAAN